MQNKLAILINDLRSTLARNEESSHRIERITLVLNENNLHNLTTETNSTVSDTLDVLEETTELSKLQICIPLLKHCYFITCTSKLKIL